MLPNTGMLLTQTPKCLSEKLSIKSYEIVSAGKDEIASQSHCPFTFHLTSSSRMGVTNHNWWATKHRLHSQSVAEISQHSVCQGRWFDNVEHRLGFTTRTLSVVAISFCRHRSVPVSCKNGSGETTVAEGGRNPVARFWGHTLGQNWSPSSYVSIDF